MTQNSIEDTARISACLKKKLLHLVPEAGLHPTAVEGVRLSRRNETGKPEHCFDKPLVSIIVQGAKQALIGSANIKYGENQCLVVGVDMPSAFQVSAASPDQPFLAVGMHLNKQLTTQLMTEIALPPEPEDGAFMGVSVIDAETNMLDAFLRLLGILDSPERIPVLAPMIVREIHYLLLTSPQGGQLRRIHTFGTQSNQVAKAISWMRDNYKESVPIDALAQKVSMATSTFHRHFKEVTTLSPLQYVKRLRLYEAQRLMLVERQDASSAGFAVGYESVAQFNREYKRLFGEPPMRDVRRLL